MGSWLSSWSNLSSFLIKGLETTANTVSIDTWRFTSKGYNHCSSTCCCQNHHTSKPVNWARLGTPLLLLIALGFLEENNTMACSLPKSTSSAREWDRHILSYGINHTWDRSIYFKAWNIAEKNLTIKYDILAFSKQIVHGQLFLLKIFIFKNTEVMTR